MLSTEGQGRAVGPYYRIWVCFAVVTARGAGPAARAVADPDFPEIRENIREISRFPLDSAGFGRARGRFAQTFRRLAGNSLMFAEQGNFCAGTGKFAAEQGIGRLCTRRSGRRECCGVFRRLEAGWCCGDMVRPSCKMVFSKCSRLAGSLSYNRTNHAYCQVHSHHPVGDSSPL